MNRGQRALAYIRVSVVGDRAARGRFESPDLQREAIDQWARQRGVIIVGEIQDLNRSGGTLTRPGLQQARTRLNAGEADGLVVLRSDRASRNVIQGLSLMDELEADGKWIAATDGTIDSTTPEARMATTIYLATSERELARFKQQSAVIHRRAIVEKGRHMGPTPFGYVRDSDGRLTPDPARAKWVRHVFQRRAEGTGWVQISRELASAKVTQTNGRALNPHLLRRMVRHRVYLGEASHGEHLRVDAHPALIDEALWVAAKRATPTVQSSRHDAQAVEPLLRGLLRCGGCRYVLKRLPTKQGGNRWRCRTITTERSATHECDAPAKLTAIEAVQVEQAVVQAFMELAAGAHAERRDDTADVEALERQATDAEALLDELSSLDVRRELGADRWSKLVKEAREDVQTAHRELAAARAHRPAVAGASVTTLEGLWDGMTPTERQDALRSIVQAVMVMADGTIDVVPVWEVAELPRKGALFSPVPWAARNPRPAVLAAGGRREHTPERA
jgi:site-specific DNA recombinase